MPASSRRTSSRGAPQAGRREPDAMPGTDGRQASKQNSSSCSPDSDSSCAHTPWPASTRSHFRSPGARTSSRSFHPRAARPGSVRAADRRGGSDRARRRRWAGSRTVGPDAASLARGALALRLRAAGPAAHHAAGNRGERGARRETAAGRGLDVLALAPRRLPAGDGPRGASRRGARVARTGPGPGRGAPPDAAGEPRGRRGLVRLASAAPARPARRGCGPGSSESCRRRWSSAGCTSARAASCCSRCSCTPPRTPSAASSPGRCSRAPTSPASRGSAGLLRWRLRSCWCSGMRDCAPAPVAGREELPSTTHRRLTSGARAGRPDPGKARRGASGGAPASAAISPGRRSGPGERRLPQHGAAGESPSSTGQGAG